jgi:two-component system sensor histidine kinase RpfC
MDARELLGAVARLTERSDEAGPGHSDSPRTAIETKRSTSALRTTNQPLVDESKLKALLELGLDGAFFDELVSGFLRDAERSLSQLSSAAQERDYPEFRGAIHALQGSAGELGAIGIVTLCNELKQLKPFELGSPPTRRLIDDVRQVVSRSGVVLTEFAREQRKVIT